MRIGHGYDVHRLKNGRRFVLCGVELPVDFGPDGHSDADVPVHALIDALLGAASLGDIGTIFPDSDDRYKDASSISLLASVYDLVIREGYEIGNADITIVLEKPRIGTYIDKMRAVIADTLKTNVSNISIKATTEEGLGVSSNLQGISSFAVVLLFAISG